jgi:hypothetical protein
MKKIFIVLTVVFISVVSAAQKGGLGPCLATCCIGPRVGLEMNEGTKIRNTEWMGLVGNLVLSPVGSLYVAIDPTNGKTMNQIKQEESLGGPTIQAKGNKAKGGPVSFLTSCCFGPRVALEGNNGRNIRTIEWIGLIVPVIPALYMDYEAFSGKTMSAVAAEEGLDK